MFTFPLFNPTRDVLDQLKALLQKAGLPEIRFHDLRHSAATMLLGMGVHPKIVQEILGHNQISMTLDTYSHVLPTLSLPRSINVSKSLWAVLSETPVNCLYMLLVIKPCF
jgi:integrase